MNIGRLLSMLRFHWKRIVGMLLVLAGIGGSQIYRAEASFTAQQGGPPYKVFLPAVSNGTIRWEYGPEIYTTSYYISSLNLSSFYTRGCELGTRDLNRPGYQDNVVILDFGGPRRLSDGSYGVRLFTSGTYVSNSAIASAVIEFGRGYYICAGSDLYSRLVIGIGTNSVYYDTSGIYQVNYDHGRAWAQMVNSVNSWFITNGYSSQVSAVGATDMELSYPWAFYSVVRNWLQGYDSANQYELINYGALEGCPYASVPTPQSQCAWGWDPSLGDNTANVRWTYEQVWYINWGSPPVYPLPEIYATSGVNAQQWYRLSRYSKDYHGIPFEFRGVMTQWQACQQRGGCSGIDNTPLMGWTQLNNYVNGDPLTAHIIKWVTDIKW